MKLNIFLNISERIYHKFADDCKEFRYNYFPYFKLVRCYGNYQYHFLVVSKDCEWWPVNYSFVIFLAPTYIKPFSTMLKWQKQTVFIFVFIFMKSLCLVQYLSIYHLHTTISGESHYWKNRKSPLEIDWTVNVGTISERSNKVVQMLTS